MRWWIGMIEKPLCKHMAGEKPTKYSDGGFKDRNGYIIIETDIIDYMVNRPLKFGVVAHHLFRSRLARDGEVC